jgi:hypothetical protein
MVAEVVDITQTFWDDQVGVVEVPKEINMVQAMVEKVTLGYIKFQKVVTAVLVVPILFQMVLVAVVLDMLDIQILKTVVQLVMVEVE